MCKPPHFSPITVCFCGGWLPQPDYLPRWALMRAPQWCLFGRVHSASVCRESMSILTWRPARPVVTLSRIISTSRTTAIPLCGTYILAASWVGISCVCQLWNRWSSLLVERPSARLPIRQVDFKMSQLKLWALSTLWHHNCRLVSRVFYQLVHSKRILNPACVFLASWSFPCDQPHDRRNPAASVTFLCTTSLPGIVAIKVDGCKTVQ